MWVGKFRQTPKTFRRGVDLQSPGSLPAAPRERERESRSFRCKKPGMSQPKYVALNNFVLINWSPGALIFGAMPTHGRFEAGAASRRAGDPRVSGDVKHVFNAPFSILPGRLLFVSLPGVRTVRISHVQLGMFIYAELFS